MLNHITIMGRMVRDPELRRTGSGTPVASFTIACDRDFGGQDGQKETDFIDCVAWRGTGEAVAKYFTKGRMIIVSGRLQIRTWKDKDGNNRRNAEIVADHVYFGDSKPDNQGGSYSGNDGRSHLNNYGGYYPPPQQAMETNNGMVTSSPQAYPAQQGYGTPAPESFPGYPGTDGPSDYGMPQYEDNELPL